MVFGFDFIKFKLEGAIIMKVLKNQEGLTLIEAIVALVLMIVLVAAFSGAFVTGLNREVEVDKRMSASNLANSMFEYIGEEGKLNELVSVAIDDKMYFEIENSNSNSLPDEFLNPLEDSLFDSLIKESSYILIKDISGADTENLYRVTINIVWEDRGNNHNYNMVKLMVDD